jgi:ribonuclease HII
MNLHEFDMQFFREGYLRLCGIDEAGRGPLAGPVVAAAAVFNSETFIPDVNDSKKISENLRERLFDIIIDKALAYGVGIVECGVIDQINVLAATHLAARKAIEKISPSPDLIITDYLKLKKTPAPVRFFVKGDMKSHAIAAASIIAKVTRDRMMMDYDKQYPEYNFAGNKGYGTKQHREALEKYGPCPIHRYSFRGVVKQSLF